MLETLGSGVINESAPMLHMILPPQKLVSTRSAISAAKRGWAAAGNLRVVRSTATFRTFIRAEVMCIGGGKARSFRVYSRELYACTDRNLRKLCVPQKSGSNAEPADLSLVPALFEPEVQQLHLLPQGPSEGRTVKVEL